MSIYYLQKNTIDDDVSFKTVDLPCVIIISGKFKSEHYKRLFPGIAFYKKSSGKLLSTTNSKILVDYHSEQPDQFTCLLNVFESGDYVPPADCVTLMISEFDAMAIFFAFAKLRYLLPQIGTHVTTYQLQCDDFANLEYGVFIDHEVIQKSFFDSQLTVNLSSIPINYSYYRSIAGFDDPNDNVVGFKLTDGYLLRSLLKKHEPLIVEDPDYSDDLILPAADVIQPKEQRIAFATTLSVDIPNVSTLPISESSDVAVSIPDAYNIEDDEFNIDANLLLDNLTDVNTESSNYPMTPNSSKSVRWNLDEDDLFAKARFATASAPSRSDVSLLPPYGDDLNVGMLNEWKSIEILSRICKDSELISAVINKVARRSWL